MNHPLWTDVLEAHAALRMLGVTTIGSLEVNNLLEQAEWNSAAEEDERGAEMASLLLVSRAQQLAQPAGLRVRGSDGVEREPSAHDLQAHLERHPATYAQLLETAQVAAPWRDHFPRRTRVYHRWVRWDARGGRLVPVGETYQRTPTDLWRVRVLNEEFAVEYETAAEAREVIDAHLRDLSWALVGSPS